MKEFVEEIEHLNIDNANLSKELNTQNDKFTEQKLELKKTFNQEIQTVLKDLSQAQIEIKTLKDELEITKKIQNYIEPESTSNDEYVEALMNDIRLFENKIQDLKDEIADSQKQCIKIEETQQNLRNEKECLQETMNMKSEELKQANELIQNLQDDITCLKYELESSNIKPLDGEQQSNSLFAEVYESHAQLKKDVKKKSEELNRVNNHRKILLGEIQQLKTEKTKLIRMFETDSEIYRPGNYDEIDSYRFEIDGLVVLSAGYRRELEFLKKQKTLPSPTKDYKYFESLFKRKETELKSLQENLDRHTLGLILQERQLAKLRAENVNCKERARNLQNENGKMKLKIQESEKTLGSESSK